ncbi:hypothetical protein [Microseira wollei]|uniref:hypothetical protein n=1 Tax=Microseira wollei TaxID=467598 RepID=UPI001CFD8552|nr:hypothetical protein [Microseira wollei]
MLIALTIQVAGCSYPQVSFARVRGKQSQRWTRSRCPQLQQESAISWALAVRWRWLLPLRSLHNKPTLVAAKALCGYNLCLNGFGEGTTSDEICCEERSHPTNAIRADAHTGAIRMTAQAIYKAISA